MEDKLEKLKKKNDLSDIILEKDDASGDRIKKILLGAASLVLLGLIVLIGMKMFNSSNISPSESLANVGENIEKTGDDLVDGVQTAVDDTSDSLFKKEPIIDENSETDQKFEEMVRKLKKQDSLETPDSVEDVDKELSSIIDSAKDEVKSKEKELIASAKGGKDAVVDKIKDITSSSKEKATEKVQEVIKTVEPQVIATSKPVSKPVVIHESEPVVVREPIIESKPIKRRVSVETPRSSYKKAPDAISSMSGYFIQVGATSKSFPDRRFLQKIKNNGYDYIVHKVAVKGRNIKKVLVGPYGSRDQARNELSGVQSSINPSAYIYRIK